MKTKNIFKTLAFAMLMPAMMLTTACSNEDDVVNNAANSQSVAKKGYTLPVTVNVTRQGDEGTTRTTYTYDEGTKKGTLAFSEGDKLFVEGQDNKTAGSFKGVLTWVSGGTFSGSINTQKEYTGTADALFTSAYADGYVTATLLPAGYESYAFLSIEDETDCSGWVGRNLSKAFAPTKKAAVEQFSYEYAYSYNSGFALSPMNAIVSFTISGLAANTEVAVLFEAYGTGATPVNVTTDASGVATFAVAVNDNDYIDYYTLTVDGIDITLPDKTAEAGKIYNITRSAAPAAKNLAEATAEDIGKVVGADGKIYANVAAPKAASTTACAIIAYVGSATGESQNHGLAIAMKDAAAGCYIMWSSSNNDESQLTNYTDVSQAVSTFQSGLSNSQYYEFDNETDYPAFYAALHNTISTSDGISADAPDPGTSGWFLPSLYQWNKIVQGLSGQSANLSDDPNDNYTASSLNAKITAAGGDGLQEDGYWSSTEYDGNYAWLFEASGGRVINKSPKNYEYYVRSVFAF